MELALLQQEAADFLREHPRNFLTAADTLRDDLYGMRFWDEPLFAAGDADDSLFREMKQVVEATYLTPQDWLPQARTVLAFFLPFSEQVRRANGADLQHPVDEWLYARIEGHEMLLLLSAFIADRLRAEGEQAVVPATDSRMRYIGDFSSNWSERHTAYICGLGTFGLSKGLITARGIAGRFGSVVTSAAFPITPRPYRERYEYCSRCGKCARNCPALAIDCSLEPDLAKNHELCNTFLDTTYDNTDFSKRRGLYPKKHYGCGKCQVKVPCENRIPKKAQQKRQG